MNIHKEFCLVTVMEENGKIVRQERIECSDDALRSFLQSSAMMENEVIEDVGYEVILAHPLKTRAIAEAKIKTDKVDSEILSWADLIPRSYVPQRMFVNCGIWSGNGFI